MQSGDVDHLEALRREVAAAHAAVVASRECLIESMGDRMCGSGDGPLRADIQAFELAVQKEANARARWEVMSVLVGRWCAVEPNTVLDPSSAIRPEHS